MDPQARCSCPCFCGPQTLVRAGDNSIWVAVKIMIPFLGTLKIRCRIMIGIQKGPTIWTTTHILGQIPLQQQPLDMKFIGPLYTYISTLWYPLLSGYRPEAYLGLAYQPNTACNAACDCSVDWAVRVCFRQLILASKEGQGFNI